MLCPICNKREAVPSTRKDARGRNWCQECVDEFDSIDWDAYHERIREEYL